MIVFVVITRTTDREFKGIFVKIEGKIPEPMSSAKKKKDKNSAAATATASVPGFIVSNFFFCKFTNKQ